MCGRYALHSLIEELQRHFNLFDDVQFRPRYNVAPSLAMPVVREGDNGRQLALCRWGLVPGWSKAEPKTRPINARAETVAEKPYFRTPFRRRRCLVPANGYYEWQRMGSVKQPYYIKSAGSDLLAFAGIWDRWTGSEGPIDTYAIITTAASETTRPIHDRMPVILEPGQYAQWLNTGGAEMLQPYSGMLALWPVGRRVNSPANDGVELIAPAQNKTRTEAT